MVSTIWSPIYDVITVGCHKNATWIEVRCLTACDNVTFLTCQESRLQLTFTVHTLAFSWSRSLPIVTSNLHKHSKASSSLLFSSFTTQSCMMFSVSICENRQWHVYWEVELVTQVVVREPLAQRKWFGQMKSKNAWCMISAQNGHLPFQTPDSLKETRMCLIWSQFEENFKYVPGRQAKSVFHLHFDQTATKL